MSGHLRAGFAAPMVPVALLILVFAAGLMSNTALLNDGDTSWHIATGRWIIEHGRVPATDPFSFTHRGQPWTAHEWLVDLLMAGLMNAAGWAGLVLFFAVTISFALWLVGHQLLRSLSPLRTVAVLAVLVAVLAPFMLARPHVIAWPLFALWTVAILRARQKDEAPPLALALLILLWANLHASFVFAIFVAAVFALEAFIVAEDRRQTFVRWGLFGLLCAILALGTPHGVQSFVYPFQVSGMTSLHAIDEWRPTNVREHWVFLLFTSGVAVCAVVRWRTLTVLRVLLVGLLAILAFRHSRHQPLFAILSVLILAQPAGLALARQVRGTRFAAAVGALGFTVLAAVRLAIPINREDGPTYPATALAKLPAELRTAPVLNNYSFGGPLILTGIAPFIDGRADMYGDAHTLDHRAMMDGDAARFERARRKWNLKWTILHRDEKLVQLLDRDPSWRRIHSDEFAVVHVRK